MENFRYSNVFDCRAAADDLGFSARTWLCDGMAETAALFGRQWLTSGAAETGSGYDKRVQGNSVVVAKASPVRQMALRAPAQCAADGSARSAGPPGNPAVSRLA